MPAIIETAVSTLLSRCTSRRQAAGESSLIVLERSLAVVVARVFHHAGLGAEARHHRHLAREAGAEGVDGLDAQAVGDLRRSGCPSAPAARISAAALMVKVMATISSGFSTVFSSSM